MNTPPIVVAYGGGTNSTALLVHLHEAGVTPDLILFADTGSEKPHTYKHVEAVSAWCKRVGFPEIVTVHKGGRQESLEESCLRQNMLPSIAYGYKSCSLKYKRAPQDVYVNSWQPAIDCWKLLGLKVVKLIGYDADEERRAKIAADDKYDYQYPLIEIGWGRDECISAIDRAGLPRPGKSACFFCPSSTVAEIHWLRDNEPSLFARALAMENNAELTSVKGLGRRFAWRIHANPDQPAPAIESGIAPECDCYDGGDDLW